MTILNRNDLEILKQELHRPELREYLIFSGGELVRRGTMPERYGSTSKSVLFQK